MKTMHRSAASVLLAGLAAAPLAWPTGAAGQAVPTENTVVAVAAGTIGAGGAVPEPVDFTGQASITGKVVLDTVFGGPPVLEIIIDLGKVTGQGQRTGKAYQVASQAILHRPLLAFEALEVGFSFVAEGNPVLAHAGLATFGVYYNATSGVTTTPVRISQLPPA